MDILAEDLDGALQITDNSSDRDSYGSVESSEIIPHTPSSPRSQYSALTPEMSHASPSAQGSSHALNGFIKKENISPKNGFHIPHYLHDLFNHTLWLIHHVNASHGSFVFVSNDEKKQGIARRFGIRTKRIEDLRAIVAREERDFRNRQNAYQKAKATIQTPVLPTTEDSDEEDEIVFKRSQPASPTLPPPPVAAPAHVPAPVAPTAPAAHRVYDPNSFGRGAHGPPVRGGRGRGGRGGFSTFRGNFNSSPVQGHAQIASDPNKPIDPDSFTRPRPTVRTYRGGRARLWIPS